MKLSFAEIDSQHVELLPARTVMSMFILGNCCGNGGAGGSSGGNVACGLAIGSVNAVVPILLGAGTAIGGSGPVCST
jgi:hypothetical protein